MEAFYYSTPIFNLSAHRRYLKDRKKKCEIEPIRGVQWKKRRRVFREVQSLDYGLAWLVPADNFSAVVFKFWG